MPISWPDFEQCVNDRIAYYRQSYDQTRRTYHKLLRQNTTTDEQIVAILIFQQAMVDQLSRSRRLLVKYVAKKVMLPNPS
jgi:hypothetical protein